VETNLINELAARSRLKLLQQDQLESDCQTSEFQSFPQEEILINPDHSIFFQEIPQP
jgi:hypothetical protein